MIIFWTWVFADRLNAHSLYAFALTGPWRLNYRIYHNARTTVIGLGLGLIGLSNTGLRKGSSSSHPDRVLNGSGLSSKVPENLNCYDKNNHIDCKVLSTGIAFGIF